MVNQAERARMRLTRSALKEWEGEQRPMGMKAKDQVLWYMQPLLLYIGRYVNGRDNPGGNEAGGGGTLLLH
jgi:hypothetical protein